MKKINYIGIICLVMLLFLTCGCNDRLKDIILENNYGYSSNKQSFVCDEIKDATSISRTYFVTSDGSLYEFNLSQLFSNDKNCKKVDYGNNNISYVLYNNFYDKDNNLVYTITDINGNDYVVSIDKYKEINGRDVYNSLEDINEEFDYASYGGDTKIFIKDHTVFWYDNKEKKTYEIPSNENILGLYGSVVKTDKNYYTLKNTNKEECEKYTDVKCEFNYSKSSLGEIYDDIIFASEDMLVDKDWHVYTSDVNYSLVSPTLS